MLLQRRAALSGTEPPHQVEPIPRGTVTGVAVYTAYHVASGGPPMPSLRTGRSVVCLALACAGLAVVSTPSVFAGGWAITTLDSLPNELRAGETYAIGYVIRQHGQTPFTGAHT